MDTSTNTGHVDRYGVGATDRDGRLFERVSKHDGERSGDHVVSTPDRRVQDARPRPPVPIDTVRAELARPRSGSGELDRGEGRVTFVRMWDGTPSQRDREGLSGPVVVLTQGTMDRPKLGYRRRYNPINVTPWAASAAARSRSANASSRSSIPLSRSAMTAWTLMIGEAMLAGRSENATAVTCSPRATNAPAPRNFGSSPERHPTS